MKNEYGALVCLTVVIIGRAHDDIVVAVVVHVTGAVHTPAQVRVCLVRLHHVVGGADQYVRHGGGGRFTGADIQHTASQENPDGN